jgi:hypothetical protein
MSKVDIEVLRNLLEKGRASDLLALLKGESKYNTDTGDDLPLDSGSSKVWRMAIAHVEFVSKFGLDKQRAEEGSKFYSAYPDDFEEWLSLGAPGITQEEIDLYLKENPM